MSSVDPYRVAEILRVAGPTMPILSRRHLEAFGPRDRLMPDVCPLCKTAVESAEGGA